MKAMGIPEDRAAPEHTMNKKAVPIQGVPEDGSGFGLLENVGKLNMMLRRKMRVASEEIAAEGRARQLEVTVAEGPVVRIAFPPATSHTNPIVPVASKP
jgi:hypothetical protein